MWDLKEINTDKPLYRSLADAMERDIRFGILKPGDRMPTHRELAQKVGVNVTTVTRAYREAERRGLITATVGRGTFVTSDLGRNASLLDADDGEKRRQIEMGLVLPLYEAEPDIQPVLSDLCGRGRLREFMGYTPPQGLLSHRRIAAEWVRRFGMETDAGQVILTAGTQHALHCILSAVFQPGDRIAVDSVTYPGLKSAARRCGIKLEAVAMDGQGMTPEGLETICSHGDLKGVYTAARLQNPTNAVMLGKRLCDLAGIIRKNGLILLEDDLYAFLAPDGTSPLSALLPGQSIYLNGPSKAFYAGLRVGFVVSPQRFYNRICQAVVDTLWMAPSLNAELICACIRSGLADEIIRKKREELRSRAELMKNVLREYSFRYEPDSMFTWLKLPEDRTGGAFEQEAGSQGVHVVSAEKFAVGGVVPPQYVRISLSGPENLSELEQGLSILRRLLNQELGSASGIL